MTENAQEIVRSQTRGQLLSGLRIAVLVTTTITVGIRLRSILRSWEHYDLPLAQLCALGMLAGILVFEVVLVARRRSWGKLRWPAGAVIVAASLISYTNRAGNVTADDADWAFGVANWVGLVVFLYSPSWAIGAFLAAHWTIALVYMLTFVDVNRDILLRFATGSISVIGYPTCVAVFTAVLRTIATKATRAAWEAEQVKTTEAVAAETHRRRQQQFTDLHENIVPLLRGLASRNLDPQDDQVRRQCAIQAARLRRLFAEVDDTSNRLAHELRHCADVAHRKGVLVEMDFRGQWFDPPPGIRRDLTEAPLTVLATATSWARVAVVGTAESVSVNVIADSGDIDLPQPTSPAVRLEKIQDDSMLWVEVQWRTN
ncbi:hypothetical protein [Amycolatopsis aidingensis]|uniref:hypothetical protein n=1 Tax=Amycolatopsis aidingensis TaxID=2842453 RepID=UPI001C0E3CCE|nr:hypothetical protein [Amycolatopsis aidingensis]